MGRLSCCQPLHHAGVTKIAMTELVNKLCT